MDIRIRRTITIAFFLFFFIVSPIILLYSSGYRYDFKRGTILRTGNIFIEAKDLKDATIYIDDKQYQDALNQKLFLKNLIPGDYTIRIEKAGYNTWEKKLQVEGNLTTFVKDIVLFLTSKPVELVKGPIDSYTLSPNDNFIAYIKNNGGAFEIWIRNTIYEEDQLLYRSSDKSLPAIEWAKSSNRVMVLLPKHVLVYQTSVFPYVQLADLPLDQGQSARWDNESDSLLILSSADKISRYDLVTRKNENIFTASAGQTISDVRVTNGSSILVLVEQNGTTSVQAIDNSLRLRKEIFSVDGTQISIVEDTPKYLVLANKNTNKLYLIRKGLTSLRDLLLTSDNITLEGADARLSPDQSSLLIISDFEVSILNLSDRSLRLINRFGQPITSAAWYPDNQHVILGVGKDVIISDLNTESQKTALVPIMSADSISNVELLSQDTAIVHATINKTDSIFTIQLR